MWGSALSVWGDVGKVWWGVGESEMRWGRGVGEVRREVCWSEGRCGDMGRAERCQVSVGGVKKC